MKLNRIEINAFRGFEEETLDFTENLTAFVGINGAGKSSILDCLAILLSRFFWRIRSSSGTGRFFTEYDINNKYNETHNHIYITYLGDEFDWLVTKTRKGRIRQLMTNQSKIKAAVDAIWSKLEESPGFNLPLAVYYPVNRAVIDIPLRVRKKKEFGQLEAYDLALTGSRNDFRKFFEWYRNREDLENESRRLKDIFKPDRQLEAVRNAIYSLLHDYKDLHVQRSPLRMVLKKKGTELIINQLSDGEKCLLAMVGDLARRLAIANPSRDDPLSGSGVALIDEIELHLHPAWQRTIISGLLRTFPNVQFIVTTHSPQVLGDVKQDSIYVLKNTTKGIKASRPSSQTYGRDSNQILRNILDGTERSGSIENRIDELFRLIEEDMIKEAKLKLDKLINDIGPTEPELIKAGLLIDALENSRQ
ncbi:MAG: AAA family ATPase [bacterium]|nr:AAA family ATPase [bacterium]